MRSSDVRMRRPVSYRFRELQRASDFQAALLGMAGHDLREPMQVIQGTYDLLRTRTANQSEHAWLDRGERAIGRLTEQLDHLASAVRFYDFSRRVEISAVALAPLFWKVCNDNEDAAHQRGIEMQVCPTEARVMSNPLLLEGILRNLLTNAVKYTDPGGRILIGCRRFGCDVRIDVYDTGIGIAPEDLPRIFGAFKRLDEARCEGLGLGLFVVRRALELLGHGIEIRSALSKGSRFSVIARGSAAIERKRLKGHHGPNG